MVAGAYVISVDGQVEGRGLRNGVDCVVVYANSVDDAQAIAEASFGYTQPAVWANSTYLLAAAGTDMEGWTFRVRVVSLSGMDEGTAVVDVSVTGAASDTIDDLGTAMATALNATSLIAAAAYDTSSQVLTVADTTDGLGDHEVVAEFYPAGAAQNVAIPGFVVSQVDGGSSGDALTATLAADSYAIPNVVAKIARS
jgi:hypothetical protein